MHQVIINELTRQLVNICLVLQCDSHLEQDASEHRNIELYKTSTSTQLTERSRTKGTLGTVIQSWSMLWSQYVTSLINQLKHATKHRKKCTNYAFTSVQHAHSSRLETQ